MVTDNGVKLIQHKKINHTYLILSKKLLNFIQNGHKLTAHFKNFNLFFKILSNVNIFNAGINVSSISIGMFIPSRFEDIYRYLFRHENMAYEIDKIYENSQSNVTSLHH